MGGEFHPCHLFRKHGTTGWRCPGPLTGINDCDQRETILGIEYFCSEAFSSGEGDAEMIALAGR